jgi:DNA-binding NtrC family response regulator
MGRSDTGKSKEASVAARLRLCHCGRLVSKETNTLGVPNGPMAARPPLGVVVRVLNASARPDPFRLNVGVARVGSAPECDLVVDDRTVSRVHAEFGVVPEGVSVTDLGSRNGVMYLGQRIERGVVALGTQLTLGNVVVAIDPDAESLAGAPTFEGSTYHGALGRSLEMRRIFGLLSRLEGSLTSVLLDGQSGVGKEVIARAIHEASKVASGPWVPLNCGAIPRELVASELFGHKRGAFTGATEPRRGAFQQADGGTLFLDEIGELPLDVQPMLLRCLENGEVRQLGAERWDQVRVRIIAATNRDLSEEVRQGRFREDLFYRLAVVRVHIPALSERPEDVVQLAEHFAKRAAIEPLPAEVMGQLTRRPWPGNARELRNVVSAYATLGVIPEPRTTAPGRPLFELGLEEFMDVTRPFLAQKDELIDRFSRRYMEALLEHTDGNQSQAARIAGLDRTYFGRLISRLGLRTKR